MAAIDKIYVNTYDEYLKFKDWCKEQPPLTDKYGKQIRITAYLYNYDEPFEGEHPIFNAPYYVDAYVIRNCPFGFIQDELMLNYGHKSQKIVNEMYEVVKSRNGEKGKEGEHYYWCDYDSFEIIDNVIHLKDNEDSAYMRIKRNEDYTSPFTDMEYTIGKHFKCIKHPPHLYNKPFRYKNWDIHVDVPNGYMWYHEEYGTWDFMDEFVISEWSSSCCFCPTIKALQRKMIKWKLPVGTKVTAYGKYVADTYEFIITK